MNPPYVYPTNARPTPTGRFQNTSAQVDCGADPQSKSSHIRGTIAVIWTELYASLGKILMTRALSFVVDNWHRVWPSVVAQLRRTQERTRLMADEVPRDLVAYGQPSPAQSTSPKKVSWSYLRGLCMASTSRRAIVNKIGPV